MNTVNKGDRVLFVPLVRGWNKRYYMVGLVTEVIDRYVKVTDLLGVKHVDFVDKVVLLSKGVDCGI